MKKFLTSILGNRNEIDKDYLVLNNLVVESIPRITNFDKLAAHYSFTNKTINIPENYNYLIKHQQEYKSLYSHFKHNFEEYVGYHEIGHAIHHQTLNLDNNNYIKFNNQEINSFLSRPTTESTKIDNFIHMNFTEAYADCYAGLVIYLKNNNKQFISEISEFRKNEYESMKNNNSFILKENSPLVGKMAVTQYANYYALDNFKNNFIDVFNQQEILDMSKKYSFIAIHDFIQLESLRGLKDTLINEINTNPLFAKDFDEYCKNINNQTNTKDYLNKLEKCIEDVNSDVYKKLVGRDLVKRDEIKIISNNLKINHLQYMPDSTFNNLISDNQKIDINSRFCAEPNEYNDNKLYNSIVSSILQNKNFSLVIKELENNQISQYTMGIKSAISKQNFSWIENQSNIKPKLQLNQTILLTDNQIFNEYEKTLDNNGKKEFIAIKNKISKLYLPNVLNETIKIIDSPIYKMERVNLNILSIRDNSLNSKTTSINTQKFIL